MKISRRALFAAPMLAGRPTFAAPSSGKVITLPILLLHDRILMMVKVNGSRPLLFALDSGDSVFATVTPKLAQELKLKISGAIRTLGVGGADLHPYYEANIVIGETLSQTGVLFNEVDLHDDFEGLLPAHMLLTQDAEIDFTRSQLRLYLSGSPDLAGYTAIPYDSGHSNHQVIVQCRLDDRPLRLLVDTGAPNGITLSNDYVAQNDLWSPTSRFMEGRASGTAGSTWSRTLKMKTLSFGPTRFHDPIVELLDPQHARGGRGEFDGLLGLDITRRFDMTFQRMPRPTLYVKPNAMLTEPFAVDRSGLKLGHNKKGEVIVIAVAPGSAGEAAGVHEGDLLPNVQDDTAGRALVWRLQDGAGTQVPLEVLRDGKTQSVTLTLADRI